MASELDVSVGVRYEDLFNAGCLRYIQQNRIDAFRGCSGLRCRSHIVRHHLGRGDHQAGAGIQQFFTLASPGIGGSLLSCTHKNRHRHDSTQSATGVQSQTADGACYRQRYFRLIQYSDWQGSTTAQSKRIESMESHSHDTNKYAELSRWCIGEADNYLRRRNNIQASEQGWGTVAQALKAIADRCLHTPFRAEKTGRLECVSAPAGKYPVGPLESIGTTMFSGWNSMFPSASVTKRPLSMAVLSPLTSQPRTFPGFY